ncbi:MAG: acyltransferase family protein [Candidatus Pacearchaeota archaeon]|jgi:peptidoglycan/LPS O-acetylase OafA/YrhL
MKNKKEKLKKENKKELSNNNNNNNRNIQLDLFKAFAILAIILKHFGIIPSWSFVFAIPLFVFVSASLYYEGTKNIRLDKMFKSFIWIFGIIGIITLLFKYFKFSKFFFEDLNGLILPQIASYINRNPYLGNLWYFLLYFQILIVIFLLNKNKPINLKKYYFGILVFIISITSAYIIYFLLPEGYISPIVLSWLFIIYLGYYYYEPIRDYFNKKNVLLLIVHILASLLMIFLIMFIGKEQLVEFLKIQTHDFLFPTFIMQFFYFVIIFSITELMIRYLPILINKPFVIIGRYSLYLYLFHFYLYKLSYKLISEYSLSEVNKWIIFLFVIITGLLIGYILEIIRVFIFKEKLILKKKNK